LIGLLTAFVLLGVIGNIIEGADALTATQVAQMQSMTESQLTESKDPDTGGVVTYGSNPKSVVEAIISAITMDWPWLYDIDKTLTEDECEATSGYKWNGTSCQTPNQYYIIWAIIYWPISIAIMFSLIVLIFRILRGG